MTRAETIAFLEDYATRHPDIQHGAAGKKRFFKSYREWDTWQAGPPLAEANDGPYLVFVAYNAHLEGSAGTGAMVKVKDCELWLIAPCSSDDHVKEAQVRDQLETIADKLVNKIHWDSREQEELFWSPHHATYVEADAKALAGMICLQLVIPVARDWFNDQLGIDPNEWP